MSAIPFAEASERIKSGLDIVEVVQRHVILKKHGRSYTGKCPFHNDKSPSMNVNREKGIFKCFACGVGGDAFTFLMKIENRSFGELIRDLADEQGIEIQREGRFSGTQDAEQFAQRKDAKDRLQQLMQASGQFYCDHLGRADSTHPVRMAISKRYPDEIDCEDVLERFSLGYAPAGWDNLSIQLKQQFDFLQSNPDILMDAGLASARENGQGHYDRFRDRLIIPIHDEQNRLIAFGARSLHDEDKPKYLNSPETVLYKKNQVLYALGQAKDTIRQTRTAIVMEGYFDVISAHLAGVTEAVGSCGTALTEQHLKLLSRFGAERIILAFDSDEAGLKAALSAIELMMPYLENITTGGPELSVQVLTVPNGKDPDDYIRQNGALAFRDLMANAQTYWRFRCEMAIRGFDVSDPEARLQAVARLTPVLSSITRPTVREEASHQYAERLGVSQEALALEVKRFEKGQQTRTNSFPKKAILETPAPFNSVTQSISPSGANNLLPAPWNQHQDVAEKTLLRLLLAAPDHLPFMRSLLTAEARDFFINPQHQEILIGLLDNDALIGDPATMLAILNDQAAEKPELLYCFTDLLFTSETLAESLEFAELPAAALPERLQALIEEQLNKLHDCQRRLKLLALRADALLNQDSDIIQTYEFHDQYNKRRLPNLGAG